MFQNLQEHLDISLCGAQNEISIGWENLQYEVIDFSKLRKKLLLRGLNGHFKCGSLNGLLGPSGAGKTTLLNCFSKSQANSGLSEHSKIYANIPAKSSVLSCFIEQHVHESMFGKMSVRAILEYAFRLKNSTINTNRDTMGQHINKIMHQLMLPSELLEQDFERCSGGQQKRIAIGQELMSLSMPVFLFVDEPTTGLDTVSAFEVINCLKQLTLNHRITVIVSIHAPNNETLNLFDQIYVLAKGGVAIYSGSPNGVESYLKKEIQLNIPPRQPPIEALMKIACNGIHDQNVTKLAEKCSTSELDQFFQQNKVKNNINPTGIPNSTKRFSIYDLFYNFSRQFQITFSANMNAFLLTNVVLAFLAWFVTTMFDKKMSIPSGCISLDNSTNSTAANCLGELNESAIMMRENITFLWLGSIFTSYFATCISALFVAPFVKMFQNEHRNNWYSLSVFYLSITLTSLIEISILTLTMAITSYFCSHQHSIDDYELNWHRFGWYLGIFWLNNIYMQSVGQLIGTIFVNHVEVSVTVSIVTASIIGTYNPIFYDLDKSENALLIKTADLVGVKFLAKAFVYALYSIGRCGDGTLSNNMLIYHINPDKVLQDLIQVCFNLLIIRLVTFIFMFCKFGDTFKSLQFMKLFLKFKKSNENFDENANSIEIEKGCCKVQTLEAKMKTTNDILRNKIIIQWRNLTLFKNNSLQHYFIVNSTNNNATNKILHNLNGQLRFGTLVGLMGCSGSGKTSLLKVLNGQLKSGLSADTCFYLSKFVAIKSCFIAQNVSHHLMPGLTAKQLLIYASRLKNTSLTGIDHSKKALSLLHQLDMAHIGHTKVDNCSGGERKRLAIALELIGDRMPNLICIDEPTSGLDSNTAEMVISCLNKLCTNHNITIVCSLHQPNAEIVAMLDHLYVLSLGGSCVYSGSPLEIESHLSKVPEIGPIDCRFAIEVLIKHACETNSEIVHKLVKQNSFQFEFHELDSNSEVTYVQDGVMRNRTRFRFLPVAILTQRYLSYIIGIYWKDLIFDFCFYLTFCISVKLMFESKISKPSGCINIEDDFSNACARSQENVFKAEVLLDNYKYTFLLSSVFYFIMMLQTTLSIKQDLTYFWAEHQNGWYSSGTFYLTKRICEIVLTVPKFMACMYICNIYEEILPGIYWNFVLILLLASLSIQAISHICALLSGESYIIMTVLGTMLMTMFILLSNIFVYLHKLSYIYRFLANFSIVRFTFEAFILLQYGFGRCGDNEIQGFLYIMQIDDSHYYHCVIMFIVNAVLLQIVAIWLLVRKANPVQRQRIERLASSMTNLGHRLPLGQI